MSVPPFLTPGCPWYELNQQFPPNVKWCEAPRCAWVVEPANAWSNLAYLLVGALLLVVAARRPARSALPRQFGVTALIVGTCSLIYHASDNFLTQVLDFFAMYTFFVLLICHNLRRLGWLRPERFALWRAVGVLGLTALTPPWHWLGLPVQAIVALALCVILATEALTPRLSATGRRRLAASLGVLALAAACSALDVSRTVCFPNSPILQGHAAWHLLSAVSMLCAFLFYDHVRNGEAC